jgi:hypothetical protein
MIIHQLPIRISLRDWLSFFYPLLMRFFRRGGGGGGGGGDQLPLASLFLFTSYSRGERRPVTAGCLMHHRRHFASRWPPTPIASKTETHSPPGNYVTVTFLAVSAWRRRADKRAAVSVRNQPAILATTAQPTPYGR